MVSILKVRLRKKAPGRVDHRTDEDHGFGFTAAPAEVIECLVAVIAALLSAVAPFQLPWMCDRW